MTKKTKIILASIIAFVLLLALFGTAWLMLKGDKQEPQVSKKPPINEPVNIIALKDRPYINLTPRTDGRELTLEIASLPLSATEVEYEIEYQAGTLLQGAFGSIDFSVDPIPVSKKVLLGSCSAGGACSYHQDVVGGTITLKFRGEPNYALKDEWRFIETKSAAGQFSSRDSKFQLDAGTKLNQAGYVIVMQTSGLPAPTELQVLSGPYGLYTPATLPTATTGELSMFLTSDSETAQIYGWDGQKWIPFDTTIADKTATATVDLLPVYIAAE